MKYTTLSCFERVLANLRLVLLNTFINVFMSDRIGRITGKCDGQRSVISRFLRSYITVLVIATIMSLLSYMFLDRGSVADVVVRVAICSISVTQRNIWMHLDENLRPCHTIDA